MEIVGLHILHTSPYLQALDCLTLCVAFSVSIFTGTFVSDTHSTVHSCEFFMWTVELYKLSMWCSQWLCTCTAQFAVYCCHCLSHGTITGDTVYSSIWDCMCVRGMQVVCTVRDMLMLEWVVLLLVDEIELRNYIAVLEFLLKSEASVAPCWLTDLDLCERCKWDQLISLILAQEGGSCPVTIVLQSPVCCLPLVLCLYGGL